METEMIGKVPVRVARMLAAVLAVTAVSAAGAGAAGAAEVVYTDLPEVKPGNVVSQAFEATQTSSFGGQIELAGTARKNPSISVIMSSWACQTGTWFEGNCHSEMGAKFELPITFSINEVGPGNSVGPLLGSATKTFKIAYRPSANNKKCTGEDAGKWYHMGTCFNGKAVKIYQVVKLASVPSKVIVTVAYNTSDYGATPQRPQTCNSEPQGCPYDSLNVGVQDGFENPSGTAPTVGAFPAPDIAYRNGALEEEWTGFQPLLQVKAAA
jgi:hypothetical protein